MDIRGIRFALHCHGCARPRCAGQWLSPTRSAVLESIPVIKESDCVRYGVSLYHYIKCRVKDRQPVERQTGSDAEKMRKCAAALRDNGGPLW